MTRRVSDFIHDYVAKVSPRSEAPVKFHYWAAVAAVSGALRRRCYIDMGMFKWVPNWYILFVGPPGIVKKSTACENAMNILRSVEGINFGADVNTWQGFVTEVANAVDMFASGGGGQTFMEQEYTQTNAMTLVLSEFGAFFDPKNLAMVNVMTDLWDDKDRLWKKGTKTGEDDLITSPFVNMIACTTPRWMLINFKGQFEGWGFSARCIFVHAAKKEREVPFPDELWGPELHTWQQPFAETLQHISQLEGPYTLTPDAREFGRDWYITNSRRIEVVNANPHGDAWTADFLGRKQVHKMKLALVLAASRRDERVITLDDISEAATRLDEVEDEIGSIFGRRLLASRDVRLNFQVWQKIEGALRDYDKIKEQDVYGYTAQFMAYGRAKEFIENLKRARVLETEVAGAVTYLRRGPGQMTETITGERDEDC